MDIVLIKSYTENPWRSPETYQLIENSLKEKWHVKSIHTKNPKTLHSFFIRLKHESSKPIFAFNIAEYLDEKK